MTIIDVTLSALLASLIIFVTIFVMNKIDEWKYRRRRAAEQKARRDDLQDRRLDNLESR